MSGLSAAYGLLASLLVGVALGYFVDQSFHVAPLGIIGGTLLGFAAGLYGVYKALMKP